MGPDAVRAIVVPAGGFGNLQFKWHFGSSFQTTGKEDPEAWERSRGEARLHRYLS